MTSRRVVVVTYDPLTARMPGPAIRAWHLADVLAREHEVVLASTVACDRRNDSFEAVYADDARITALAASADVVVAQSSVVRRHPAVAAPDGPPLAIDLYDPYHLENLEPSGQGDQADLDTVRHLTAVLNEDLARGDFFVCASERQRDFWLGSLAAMGRVNPLTYAGDPLLYRLIATVPFGIPPQPPRMVGPGLRPQLGIEAEAPVVVWAGGVYNWLDPLSVIRAMPELSRDIPGVRLVFVGMGHPNPHVPAMRVAAEARRLAGQLGLTGSTVVFNEGWVPYEERAGYLLDATAGVSTHLDHLETRFSFRTRILDYLWAELPMVVTGGDALAEMITRHQVGLVVAPGDVDGITSALYAILTGTGPTGSFAVLKASLGWPVAAGSLLEYCRQPWRAADLA